MLIVKNAYFAYVLLKIMDTTIPPSRKVNWGIINALRGIAALGVVINHSRGWLFSNDVMYAANVRPKAEWQWWEWLQIRVIQFTGLGSEFVIFFFVLSGFSIAHSLSHTGKVKDFYVRRLIRLYPTYILGLFWAFIVFQLVRVMEPQVFYNTTEGNVPIADHYKQFISLSNFIPSLFYIHDTQYLTPQYWSLPLEVIFYLLAPWIIKNLKLADVITLILCLVGIWLFGIHYQDDDVIGPIRLYIFDYGIFFIAGILFYKYRGALTNSFPKSKWLYYLGALLLFVIMALTKGYVFHEASTKITGLLAATFTWWLLFGALKNNITVGWLDKIGNYSYTLYVTHFATVFSLKIVAVRLGFNFYLIHNLFFWYAGIICSVAVAYLLYFIAERPSIKKLQKLRAVK
jgi:peptidoglycan/LPS O-acetylase OafA/YrhL